MNPRSSRSAVASGEECLALLDQRSVDLVLLDVWLDGIDGLETLERIRTNGMDPMVVMISGHASTKAVQSQILAIVQAVADAAGRG